MNTFDIIIAIVLLFGFIRGLLKGLLTEIASLVALIGGIYIALHFSYFVGNFLKASISWDDKYISFVAFGITFISIILLVTLLGKLLTKLVHFVSLGMINRVLGAAFGFLKMGIILSIIFIFFGKINNMVPFVEHQTLKQSILYEPIKGIAPMIFPSIIKNGDSINVKAFPLKFHDPNINIRNAF